MKRYLLNTMAFCKKICNAIMMFLRFLNGLRLKYWASYPHRTLRVILVVILIWYLGYLLKCFLTVPIKDYYVDVYTVSKDSVTAQIDFTIGNKNIFNTYATSEFNRDSCMVECQIFEYKVGQCPTKDGFFVEAVPFSKALDSIYILSKSDTCYQHILTTYNREKHYQHLENDTLSDYMYVHIYGNLSSSSPIGYYHNKKSNIFSDSIYYCKDLRDQPFNLITYGGIATSPFILSLNNSEFSEYSRLSLKPLSPNHEYWEMGFICRYNSIGHYDIGVDYYGVKKHMSEGITYQPGTFKKMGLYKYFPRLMLFLLKEDISQSIYKYNFHSNTINTYTINIHTRSGAEVSNNPSDELKVLNLHDVQITKHKRINKIYNDNFMETDLLVKFPENSNIQYIRLFLVTVLIGWLIEVFFSNLDKIIKEKKKSYAQPSNLHL